MKLRNVACEKTAADKKIIDANNSVIAEAEVFSAAVERLSDWNRIRQMFEQKCPDDQIARMQNEIEDRILAAQKDLINSMARYDEYVAAYNELIETIPTEERPFTKMYGAKLGSMERIELEVELERHKHH